MVAGYLQWNKVRSENYHPYELVIAPEYRDLPQDEYVHNHKGDLLYFYNYNPNDIPILNAGEAGIAKSLYRVYGIYSNGFTMFMGSSAGIDCEGTPTFSHFTADYLGTHGYNLDDFEPLTVGKVLEWYEWFIYRLDKAKISCK